MRLLALLSGGKDSIYALKKVWNDNDILVAIAIDSGEESKFFHRENIELVKSQCECMDISLVYAETDSENELDVLKEIIEDLSGEVDGIVSGAIASNYQKNIIEGICSELGLVSLTPIWGVDEKEYMQELVKEGFEIVITEVAAEGLDKSWLGKKIDEDLLCELQELTEEYGINPAFEGGGAETLVLDCPLFSKKIQIEDYVEKWDGMRGVLDIKKHLLIDKNS